MEAVFYGRCDLMILEAKQNERKFLYKKETKDESGNNMHVV